MEQAIEQCMVQYLIEHVYHTWRNLGVYKLNMLIQQNIERHKTHKQRLMVNVNHK